jgi:hypothetical protein
VPLIKKPLSEYMRSEQVYYSFEPDEHTLHFVMDYVGEDRLVFASDYNHGDSKFPHTVESVTKRENLSAGPGVCPDLVEGVEIKQALR